MAGWPFLGRSSSTVIRTSVKASFIRCRRAVNSANDRSSDTLLLLYGFYRHRPALGRVRLLWDFDELVLALLCVPASEHLFRDAVRPHAVLSKLLDFGTGRRALEPVHSRRELARLDAARCGDEVHLAAPLAHDAHVDRHAAFLAQRILNCSDWEHWYVLRLPYGGRLIINEWGAPAFWREL